MPINILFIKTGSNDGLKYHHKSKEESISESTGEDALRKKGGAEGGNRDQAECNGMQIWEQAEKIR